MEVTSGISYQPISVVVMLDDNQAAKVVSGDRSLRHEVAVDIADNWLIYADPDAMYEEAVRVAIREWEASGRPNLSSGRTR